MILVFRFIGLKYFCKHLVFYEQQIDVPTDLWQFKRII